MNRRHLVAALAATALAALVPASASAWAPAGSAAIHPGVMTFTQGAQCTANFVYQDASATYIGQAAHCAGTGGNTQTNGCSAPTLPEGTQVSVRGAAKPGVMVYSSWAQMQRLGETDPDTCQYNDFALIELDPADVANVNPSVPYWGGPQGLGATTSLNDDVYSYGNSSLRFGVSVLSPKRGKSLGQAAGGWTHDVYTVTPGIPGDSGSGFLSADGRALGVLSTVALAPLPASNGVGDLQHEIDWMRTRSTFTGVTLVDGTQPFTAGVPVGGP